MTFELVYEDHARDTHRVLAVHRYEGHPAIVLVTTTTQSGVDPWKHFVPLDRLVIQEKP